MQKSLEISQASIAEEPRFPEGFNPVWAYIQPIKDKYHHFPPTAYSPVELSYWTQAVRDIDRDLVSLADGTLDGNFPEFHVHRVATPEQTKCVMTALNESVLHILNDHPYAYVGFANGILPHLQELYNDPMLRSAAQRRMTTTIIGGTHETHNEEKRVLTKVPEWVFQTEIIVAHDDVADSVGSVAAFTELTASRKGKRAYNHEFVRLFSDSTLTASEKENLYTHLVRTMEEAGVVAAVPFSKNDLFMRVLERTLGSAAIRYSKKPAWVEAQTAVFPHHLQFSPKEWLMGSGLDTAGDVNYTHQAIPADIRNHPAILALFKHTSLSKVRYGWTFDGMIAMDQYPEDEHRAYRDLMRWTSAHHERNFQTIIINT